jgi:hypothetical protein
MTPVSIEVGEHRFCVRAAQTSADRCIDWSQIVRVVAAKRDLFGRDLLCLFFETRPDGVIEVDESMAGWQNLLNALPARLPGALTADDWFARVLFPAFAESPVEVFARPPLS